MQRDGCAADVEGVGGGGGGGGIRGGGRRERGGQVPAGCASGMVDVVDVSIGRLAGDPAVGRV
jgi:hypothetical protein